MSKSTKEECMKALDIISFSYGYLTLKQALEDENLSGIPFQKLYRLIIEHFDNPPLKFEELCEDEPIFDKVSNCWRHVLQKDYDNEGIYDCVNDEWIDFEKDRLYAKEVKEDE